MRSKDWDLGHSNIKTSWRREEISKGEWKGAAWTVGGERGIGLLDSGPGMDGQPPQSRNGWTAPSQAADKQSEMKTKNLPLDNAVATGDAPRDVLVTRWGWKSYLEKTQEDGEGQD